MSKTKKNVDKNVENMSSKLIDIDAKIALIQSSASNSRALDMLVDLKNNLQQLIIEERKKIKKQKLL